MKQNSPNFVYIDTDNIPSVESLYPRTMLHIGFFTKKFYLKLIYGVGYKISVFALNRAIKDFRKHGYKNATKERLNSIYGDKQK